MWYTYVYRGVLVYMCVCVFIYVYIYMFIYIYIMEYYLAMKKNEIMPAICINIDASRHYHTK